MCFEKPTQLALPEGRLVNLNAINFDGNSTEPAHVVLGMTDEEFLAMPVKIAAAFQTVMAAPGNEFSNSQIIAEVLKTLTPKEFTFFAIMGLNDSLERYLNRVEKRATIAKIPALGSVMEFLSRRGVNF